MSTILNAILDRAAEIPDHVALSDGAQVVRYGELEGRVEDVTSTLCVTLGDGPGSVAVDLDNGIDWVLADLALLGIGRPCVPLAPFFTELQRESILRDAGAVAIFGAEGLATCRATTALSLPEGTAKVSYTSGSTGDAKGIRLSEAAMLATATAIVDRFGASMAGIHLPLLPLPVLLENVAGLYASLIAGGTYAPRASPELGLASPFQPDMMALLNAIGEVRATSLILVPQLLEGIVTALERTGRRLPDLRLVAVGGARVSIGLLGRAAALGLPVVQGYGLTECGSVVSIEDLGEIVRGTTGKPLGHVGLHLAPDGEIIVDCIGNLGVAGAASTMRTIKTGDIGTLDADGRLTIVGRKSTLLITAFGRNVAPEWVEESLCARPEIAQAFVHGDAEATLSAILVPSSAGADVARGVQEANQTLPTYARIDAWSVTRPFTPADGTLTPNGRLRRAAINERETSMPFFNRLVLRTAPARARLQTVPQLVAGLAGNISRRTYVAYLAQAYHHVRHTVPLMEEARARLGRSPMLVKALDDYVAEETGHEQWILDDIAACGGDPARVVCDGPSAATAAMVDHAYRTIREHNPAAFFGMVFVLEGTSTALATQGAEAVRRSLGLPASAFRYLTSHGVLDQEHMRFFEGLMNRVTDLSDQEAIVQMANDMFELFANVFSTIPFEPVEIAA